MANDNKVGTAELLFRQAERMGLQPSWVTHDGLFAVTTIGGERYVNMTCSALNSHTSISLAKNKFLTRLIMERHKLPNIPFARPRTYEQAKSFLEQHGAVIAKPNQGSGAQDIHIIRNLRQLRELDLGGYIFEKYIVGRELRYLILDDEVIAVHESDYGVSVAVDRPLQRISYPATKWDPFLVSMSLHIARILGMRFAAVDFLVDAQGSTHILEVNSTPGLKWFHAPSSGPAVDVAALFLEALLKDEN